MHAFRALAGGWDAVCDASGARQVLRLSAFRRIERLPGPTAPPAHVVTYRCGCGGTHDVLMSGDELDWAPIVATFGEHHDLMTGRMATDPDGGLGLWWRSMQRGHWPVTLRCAHHSSPVPAWPSCLRALEPDSEPVAHHLLVHYTCPLCDRQGMQVMGTAALELVPRLT
jgi:hypothetical protein